MLRRAALCGSFLALALGELPAQADGTSPVNTLTAQARRKLAVIVVQVGSGELDMTISDLIDEVGRLAEKFTDFRLDIVPDQKVSSCQAQAQGLFGCLVAQVRTDYDTSDPEVKGHPYSEYAEQLKLKKIDYARHLLILSVVGDATAPDRLSAILIDTDTALAYVHESKDAEEAESRINDYGVLARLPRKDIGSAREARAYLTTMITEEFRPHFERSGDWEPFGQIEFQAGIPGLEVSMDDVPLGTTQAGLNRIEKVVEGDHTIRLTNPTYEPYVATVSVVRRDTVTFEPSLQKQVSASVAGLRAGTFWTGIALAVAGTGLTVAGLASMKDVGVLCVQREDCGSRFWTEKVFRSQEELMKLDPGVDPNDGVILIVPLGYSMIGMGLSWSLGTELLTDETDVPWIPLVAGVAIGALSYGLSVALNPSTPFEPQSSLNSLRAR